MDANMPTGETMSEGSDAGDSLAAPPQVGDEAGKGVTVPAELLQGCKVGDTYTVKSVDGDNVVLEMTPGAGGEGEDSESWGKGLTEAAPRGEM